MDTREVELREKEAQSLERERKVNTHTLTLTSNLRSFARYRCDGEERFQK